VKRQLGRYQLLGELGRGGMGVVYRALDPGLGREVALKVLPLGEANENDLERFRREGAAGAAVQHPNVLPVHELTQVEGYAVLAMDLAGGGSLRDLLQREGRLPGQLVADYGVQIAKGLAALHERGVLHRDLKPENVLFSGDGRPQLADFGLAKLLDRETKLTQTGVALGSPHAMAPEQARGEVSRIGPATDVYGLGVVLFEALTGEIPIQGRSVLELLDAITRVPPRRPRDLVRGVDPGLEAIVLRCLAKEPRERYPDAQSLAAALEAWSPRGGTRGAAAGVAAALVVVLLGALGAALALRSRGPTSTPLALASATAAPSPSPSPSAARAPSQPAVGVLPKRLTVGLAGSLPLRLWRPRTLEVQGFAVPDPAPTLVVAVPLPRESAFRSPQLIELEGEGRFLELARAPLQGGDLPTPVPLGREQLLRASVPMVERNKLALLALDAEGRAACAPLVLPLELAPEWLLRLPEEQRPRGLPEGVTPTEEEGVYRNELDGSELVWVTQGPTYAHGGGQARPVELDEGVFLGRHEVTWQQFQAFLAAIQSDYLSEHSALPEGTPAFAEWFWAMEYARWAGARLPRAREWCRAAWGDERDFEAVRKRYVTGLRPVGQEREGSPFGCTDMLGNRREFTQIPVRKELIRVQGGDMRSFAFRSATTRTFGKDVDKLMQHGFRLAIDAEGRSRSGARLSWRLQACAFRPRVVKGEKGEDLYQPPEPGELRKLGPPFAAKTFSWPRPWGKRGWPASGRRLEDQGGLYLEGRARVYLAPGKWVVSALSDDGIEVAIEVQGRRNVWLRDWSWHAPTFEEQVRTLPKGFEGELTFRYCQLVGGRVLKWVLFPVK